MLPIAPTLEKRPAARQCHRAACAAGAAALLAAGPSGALEWRYTPGATVGALYDTNIRMQLDATPVNGRYAFTSVDVLGRNEALDFRFTPRFNFLRYDDPLVQDRDDSYADVSVSMHDARQRWTFGANYADEGTRNSEFESNGFAFVDYNRHQEGVSASWARLTERGQFDVAANVTSVDYQESLLNPYRDYRYNVLQGDYTRTTNERSRWGFSVSRAEVTTNRGLITTVSADARATWTYAISESLGLHVGLGMLAATTEGSVATRESAPALDFSIAQAWPRWRLTVGGGRELQPDGQGSLLRHDRLQIDASRRISERLSIGFGTSEAKDNYVFDFYDRDYWQSSFTVQWRLKRRWVLDGVLIDHGQQWVTLGLPRQTGVVSQLSIAYRGG